MTTTEVDNWPGDVAGVQGPELMQRLQQHAEQFETHRVRHVPLGDEGEGYDLVLGTTPRDRPPLAVDMLVQFVRLRRDDVAQGTYQRAAAERQEGHAHA